MTFKYNFSISFCQLWQELYTPPHYSLFKNLLTHLKISYLKIHSWWCWLFLLLVKEWFTNITRVLLLFTSRNQEVLWKINYFFWCNVTLQLKCDITWFRTIKLIEKGKRFKSAKKNSNPHKNYSNIPYLATQKTKMINKDSG